MNGSNEQFMKTGAGQWALIHETNRNNQIKAVIANVYAIVP